MTLLLFLANLDCHGQLVKGRILASDSVPVSYAHIWINGSTNGTYADANGFFDLKLSGEGSQTMSISCIGYKSREFKVKPEKDLQIFTLPYSTIKLKEITVREKGRYRVGKLGYKMTKPMTWIWTSIKPSKYQQIRVDISDMDDEEGLIRTLCFEVRAINFDEVAMQEFDLGAHTEIPLVVEIQFRDLKNMKLLIDKAFYRKITKDDLPQINIPLDSVSVIYPKHGVSVILSLLGYELPDQRLISGSVELKYGMKKSNRQMTFTRYLGEEGWSGTDFFRTEYGKFMNVNLWIEVEY